MSVVKGQQILLSFGRNSFFATLLTVVNTASGLLTSVLLARALGPKEYGRYSYIMWLTGTIALVASLGLPQTAARFIAEYHAKAPHRVCYLYYSFIRLEVLVVASLTGVLIIWGVFQTDQLLIFCVAGFLLIPIVLSRLTEATANGLQKYSIIAFVQAICTPLQLLLFVVALIADGHLLSILFTVVLIEALKAVLLIRGVKSHFRDIVKPQSFRWEMEERRRITRFSVVVFCMVLMDSLIWQKSEVFFLERFNDLEAVATYSLSYGIAYMLMQLPTAASNVLLPIFSEAYGSKSTEVLHRGYYCATKYLALLAIPLGGVATILAPQIVAVLYGGEYIEAIPVLRILLVTGVLATFNRPIPAILYSIEQQSVILKTAVVVAIINVACDFMLIPRYGVIGASCANGIAQASAVIISICFVTFRMGYIFPRSEVFKITVSTAVAGGGLYAISYYTSSGVYVIVCLFFFPVIFGIGLQIFHPWNQDDIRIWDFLEENCPNRFRRLVSMIRKWVGVATI